MRLAKWSSIVILSLAAATVFSDCRAAESPASQTAKPRGLSIFWRKSALEDVLLRGDDPKVDLAHLLHELRDTPVKTKEEAEAICNLLKRLPAGPATGEKPATSRLHAMTALFQEVETKAAFGILAEKGVPELCRIFDQLADTKDEETVDDVLFLLEVLAMYRTEAGTDRVIRAAKKPMKPEAYMWSVILSQYKDDHPQAKRLLKELGNPLPKGFLAVALLDCATDLAMDGAKIEHPFDSAEGVKRLQAWLTSRDEDEYSYAQSAAATIPFIHGPGRNRLLATALDHPAVNVQMEGAWASAKLGSEAGVKVLIRFCLDPSHSEKARQYLTELGRKESIPREALAPDFRAKAEFANWLAHPSELGRAPDELQIVDHRELPWPPGGKRKSLWLIKYRVKDTTGLAEDDIGCGLVGSVTFCLFSYKIAERPAEDAYAIHCCWEMEAKELIRDVELKQGDTIHEAMLKQWRGEPLEGPEIVYAVELSSKLKYPQRVVALATATLKGTSGWVVLDGERSTWYPKHDMPEGAYAKTVLMVHVGRRLLGFEGRPDRQKYLVKERPKRAPRQIIQAYEKLLAEASTGEAKRRKSLFGIGSPLEKHFDAFVEAQASVNGTPKAETVARTYEALLAAARSGDEAVRKEAMDGFGPLDEHFERYVDVLVAAGRSAKVESLIAEFAPRWDHNRGYGKLGTAAFRCGRYAIAERYFQKLRESNENWPRNEEMSLLAEIWVKQGRAEDAHSLLLDCLKKLLEESKSATGSDRKLFEDWFQHQRAAYLRLFPDRGDASLAKEGIPPSTRR